MTFLNVSVFGIVMSVMLSLATFFMLSVNLSHCLPVAVMKNSFDISLLCGVTCDLTRVLYFSMHSSVCLLKTTFAGPFDAVYSH